MATNEKKRKEGTYAQLRGFHRAVPIILFALAIFVALCFIIKDSTGAFGRAIGDFLLGSFSIGGYFIPVLFALHAILYPSDIHNKRLLGRIIFSLVLLIFISAMTHAISNFNVEPYFSASEFYNSGKESVGGGFVGGVFAFAIVSVIGNIGLIILAVTVITIYVTYFFATEKNPIRNFFDTVLYGIVRFLAFIEKSAKKSSAERKANQDIKAEERRRQTERREARRIEELVEREGDLYEDDYVMRGSGLSELSIPQLGISERIDERDLERNPTLQERVHPRGLVEDEPTTEPVTEHTAEEPTPAARRPIHADYGFAVSEDDYTVENGGRDFVAEAPSRTEAPRDTFVGPDATAESVFTAGFDGYDLQANERLATRRSTAAPSESEREEVPVRETRTFTSSEINAARRHGAFTTRTATPSREAQRTAEENFNPITVEFDINPDMAPEEPEAIRPQEPAREAVTEPAVTVNDVREDERLEAERIRSADAERRADEAEARLRDALRRAEEAERRYKEEEERRREQTEREAYAASSTARDTVTVVVEEEKKPEPTVVEFYDEDDAEENEGDMFTGDAEIPVSAETFVFDSDEDEEAEEGFTYSLDEEDEDEEPEQIPPERQNPEVTAYRSHFTFLKEEDDENAGFDSAPEVSDAEEVCDGDDDESDDRYAFTYAEREDDEELPELDGEDDDLDDEDEPPFDAMIRTKPPVKEEEPKAEKPDYSAFSFPSIDILAKGHEEDDPQFAEEIAEYGDKLIDALDQFDVRASIKSVDRGPRITRYEIVPARGVRVNKVINLFDDIALALAAEGIRMEAPIPGKSAIGVEIPNKHPSTVYLRDLLETDEFISEKSKTFACVGKDVTGNPVFCDVAKMPHMLIAGATGMGKSVCINSILISILYKARPDEVKLIMIDPKTVEFTMYNGIPHLLVPIVTEVKQAAGALMWAVDEMERRYALLAKHEVRKLESYNELVKEHPELGEPLPKIIIVIDELNDLMQQVKKPVEGLIMRITQKARAAGIHMIIGTQRPSVDVVTGVIKANIPSRIACKVTSFADSKTILDQSGAEKLLDKGDMLYAPVGKPKPVRVQGAFVSDGEVEKIMKHLKSTVKGNIYDEEALAEMTRAAQKCSKGKGDEDEDGEDIGGEEGAGYLNDKQFLDAVELAIKQGKISTSLIQRKISVGYGKAAKFIDIMEDLGLVSEPNGQKPRDVLVTRDQWHEMLARRSLD